MSAHESIERLKAGNGRFVTGEVTPKRMRPFHVADGHHPVAVVLSCSDARVPPEQIFDEAAGALFVVRAAGHVAGPTQIGSIEYATGVLGTPLVIVMGHSRCGAVDAALAEMRGGPVADTPGLVSVLGPIRNALTPLVTDVQQGGSADDSLALGVERNVRSVVHDLGHAPGLSARVDDGSVVVVGAVYDLETGGSVVS